MLYGERFSKVIALVLMVSFIGSLSPVSVYAQTEEPEVLASASLWVTPGEGGVIELDGVKLTIPAGAVSLPLKVTISKLGKLPELDEGMENSTGGALGYRFEPHGTKFKVPATLEMPFDRELLSSETALSNLQTYFYNEKNKYWEALPSTGIDKERAVLISTTTHFTDMINSTLQLPEGPSPIEFNPNTIKNLEAVNPAAGLAQPELGGANSQGSLAFSIKLKLPPGRLGMAPELALSYNSEGGGGILGRGFDIPVPAISTDTRFGAPQYKGNDTYLFEGENLVEIGVTARGKLYQPKVERAFKTIEYITAGNYWEVTDKNGIISTYGLEHLRQ